METFLQLALATLLGGFVGLEREYNRKEAGLRTFALVSLGSAFFTIIAYSSLGLFFKEPPIGFDPTRIIGQIVLGVGFLGAGLIIFRESRVEGLTTAAGLWVAAAVGSAVGVKLYELAIFTTILIVVVFTCLKWLEKKIIKRKEQK